MLSDSDLGTNACPPGLCSIRGCYWQLARLCTDAQSGTGAHKHMTVGHAGVQGLLQDLQFDLHVTWNRVELACSSQNCCPCQESCILCVRDLGHCLHVFTKNALLKTAIGVTMGWW